MCYSENSTISDIAVHKVGNKQQDESITLSKHVISPSDEITNLLNTYFLSPFKSQEFFKLHHDTSLELNEVYSYVSKIFSDKTQLHEQSKNLAQHLYNKSTHPNIKGGEFYVVYFTNCIFEGQTLDAIGLFKSENKDTFLKVFSQNNEFSIESQEGININKLDKGCLIYKTEVDTGYVVSVVDKTNKSLDAQYWIDEFLNISQRTDKFYNTENTLSMYKKFVVKQLPQEFDISKADQADYLNRTMDFFKEKDHFELNEFTQEVLQQDDVINSFQTFKDHYQQERDIDIADSFEISGNAVKKQNRKYKSIIKLDKNFHIYVHGNRNKIKQGEDEQGKFYKIYYVQET